MSNLHDRLRASQVNREAMIKRFGFVPHSILRLSRGEINNKLFLLQGEFPERGSRSYRATRVIGEGNQPATEEKRADQAERQRLGILGGVINKKVGEARLEASIMAGELVEFFAKYYARPGDVYLDPFAGQGVRMQIAKMLGMNYYGYDLCEEFCNYIFSIIPKIDDGQTTIQVTHGDSRFPTEIPDGIGDFSFHSPPYWDIEYYGDDPRQLGKNTYEGFLQGMQDVAAAWLPKFKPGAYHVVNVNDFRRGGKFYPYHADTITVFTAAGWELTDTWIIEGLVGGLPKAFAVDFNMKRIAPKLHEYALVFRKGK